MPGSIITFLLHVDERVPARKGKISKGDTIYNLNSGKKLKVPRLVRMHAAEMEVCVVQVDLLKRLL